MLDDGTKANIQRLLTAVREEPRRLPLEEMAAVAGDATSVSVSVSVDDVASDAVVYVAPRPDPSFDALSTREFEVATLVAAGFSNQQIADALFISIGTVKDHVHAILKTCDLPSRAAVAAAWYGGSSRPSPPSG